MVGSCSIRGVHVTLPVPDIVYSNQSQPVIDSVERWKHLVGNDGKHPFWTQALWQRPPPPNGSDGAAEAGPGTSRWRRCPKTSLRREVGCLDVLEDWESGA